MPAKLSIEDKRADLARRLDELAPGRGAELAAHVGISWKQRAKRPDTRDFFFTLPGGRNARSVREVERWVQEQAQAQGARAAAAAAAPDAAATTTTPPPPPPRRTRRPTQMTLGEEEEEGSAEPPESSPPPSPSSSGRKRRRPPAPPSTNNDEEEATTAMMSALSTPATRTAFDDVGRAFATLPQEKWEAVTAQLTSEAARVALRWRDSRAEAPFVVWTPTTGATPAPPEVRTAEQLEAFLGNTNHGTELYVGQDLFRATTTTTTTTSNASVISRLGVEPTNLRAAWTALPAFNLFASDGTALGTVPGRAVAWALAQNPAIRAAPTQPLPAPPTTQSKRQRSSSSASAAASAEKLPPIITKELLTSTESLLTQVDLADIVSLEAFVRDLLPEDRAALYPMLPTCDVRSAETVAAALGPNPHPQLAQSFQLFQNLLRTGNFDTDYAARARSKRRREPGWSDAKERQYEEFYGQRLEPKPASEAETARWRALDEAVVAKANVPPPTRNPDKGT